MDSNIYVQSLIKKLSSDDWNERKNSANTLIDMAEKLGDDLTDYLASQLNQGNDDLDFWAIRILSHIKTSKAFDTILSLSNSKSINIRQAVAMMLGNFEHENVENKKKVITILIKYLNDCWKVANRASESLVNYGKLVVNPLAQILQKGNENCAFWIIKIFCKINIDLLIQLLKFKNQQIRFLITEILKDSSDPKAIKILLYCLQDKDFRDVRKAAADALKKKGNSIIKPLMQLLKTDISDHVYYLSQEILNDIVVEISDSLVELLTSPDRDIRRNVVRLLAKIKGKKSINLLLPLLEDESLFVCKEAANSLIEIGNEVIPFLVEILEKDDLEENLIYWIIYILKEIEADSLKTIEHFLRKGRREIRETILKNLAEVETLKSIELVVKSFEDPAWPLRNMACQILSSFRTQKTTIVSIISKLLSMPTDEFLYFPISKTMQNQADTTRFDKEILEEYLSVLRDDNLSKNIVFWSRQTFETITSEEVDDIKDAILDKESFELERFNLLFGFYLLKENDYTQFYSKVMKEDSYELNRQLALILMEKSSFEHINTIMNIDILLNVIQGDIYYKNRLIALDILGKIIDEDLAETLMQFLEWNDELIQIKTAGILLQFGIEESIATLFKFLFHSSIKIKELTADTLATIKKEHLGVFLSILKSAKRQQRDYAIKVFERMDKSFAGELENLMGTQGSDMKKWIEKVIQKMN